MCIEWGTFHYHNPQQFNKFLETRVITRQILQRQHGEQLKRSIAPPPAGAALETTPPDTKQDKTPIRYCVLACQCPLESSLLHTSSLSLAMFLHFSFSSFSSPLSAPVQQVIQQIGAFSFQQPHQIVRSKVASALSTPDVELTNKITGISIAPAVL